MLDSLLITSVVVKCTIKFKALWITNTAHSLRSTQFRLCTNPARILVLKPLYKIKTTKYLFTKPFVNVRFQHLPTVLPHIEHFNIMRPTKLSLMISELLNETCWQIRILFRKTEAFYLIGK